MTTAQNNPVDPSKVEGTPETLPPVSIILITRDRHKQAESAIHSVLSCEYPAEKREIIVIEETDRPEQITGAGIRYVPIPRKDLGFAFARNIGVSYASHSLCAFLDDDCIADRLWLAAFARCMIDHPLAGACGGAVQAPECGPVGQCENILGFPGGGIRYVYESKGKIVERSTFSTCNCIVRKEALREAGGFDERFRLGGEDEMLSRAIRRRSTVLFSPYAIVCHAPRDDLAQVFFWFVRRGRARMATVPLYESPGREKRTILKNSPIVRAAVIVALALALCLPLLPVVLLLGSVYFSAMLWRYRWSRSFFPARSTFLLLPVVKVAMDIGYDAGIFIAVALRNKKSFFLW
jgi:GT2 family glycosyltransferase